MNAFGKADDTLSIAAKSIAEIITMRGTVNLDFADVKTILKDGGVAIMSTGFGEGESRVTKAIDDALHSPLLNNNDIFNAKKVMLNVSFCESSELMMEEMNEIHEFMSKFREGVEVIWGVAMDNTLEGRVKITVLATGFGVEDVPGMDSVLEKRSQEEEERQLQLEEEKEKNKERMPQARGHKARYREEAFYELEKVAKQRFNNDNVKLDVKASYIGSKIFEADHVYKSFGDLKILEDFSYIFARYEKMGIVGNNGTGKSTFIKILMGEVKADSGTIDIGETVRFGYYSQDGLQFDEQMKVIDVVQDIAEVIELGNGKKLTASQFLQHFLFTPETQHSYVYKLSGGERRRLYLCTVLMRNPNFLVLDEPTNDLDIITLNVLEEYLQNFKGCVIVVSHDRYFMDKVVDHMLVFNGQADIRDFPGNYTQYRDWKEERARLEKEKEKEASKPQEDKTAKVRLNEKRRMSFKEKREFEQLEQEIATLEEEKKTIEAALCSGTLSVEELTEKSKRLPEITDLIDEKTMRWLELSEIED